MSGYGTPMAPPETAEERMRRRLFETAGAWMQEPARSAIATVLAEELDRLRDELREEFAAKGHSHGRPGHGRVR